MALVFRIKDGCGHKNTSPSMEIWDKITAEGEEPHYMSCCVLVEKMRSWISATSCHDPLHCAIRNWSWLFLSCVNMYFTYLYRTYFLCINMYFLLACFLFLWCDDLCIANLRKGTCKFRLTDWQNQTLPMGVCTGGTSVGPGMVNELSLKDTPLSANSTSKRWPFLYTLTMSPANRKFKPWIFSLVHTAEF